MEAPGGGRHGGRQHGSGEFTVAGPRKKGEAWSKRSSSFESLTLANMAHEEQLVMAQRGAARPPTAQGAARGAVVPPRAAVPSGPAARGAALGGRFSALRIDDLSDNHSDTEGMSDTSPCSLRPARSLPFFSAPDSAPPAHRPGWHQPPPGVHAGLAASGPLLQTHAGQQQQQQRREERRVSAGWAGMITGQRRPPPGRPTSSHANTAGHN